MKYPYVFSLIILILLSGCVYQRDFYLGDGFHNDYVEIHLFKNGEKRMIFEGRVTTSALNSIAQSIELKALDKNSYIFIVINNSCELVLHKSSLYKKGNIIDIKLSENRQHIEEFDLKIKTH